MGVLVSCQGIAKSYSSRPLFTDITFGIDEGDRLGLIGPNGSGKSTLLKMVAGLVEPDQGSLVSRRQLRVAYVGQETKFPPEHTVEQIVRNAAETMPFEEHERAASVDSTLARMAFPDRLAEAGTLSGGWLKRLDLACALSKQPDLLLLDEPTNHLDLEGVLWLETLLKATNTSYVVVSHDRAFLEGITNRMLELNPTYPQGFLSNKGTYSDYLEVRSQQLTAQVNQQQALASKVRREIAWLQRGARARQTKARGRIQEAGKLIEELGELKQRNAFNTSIQIGFDASGRRTKELLVAKNVGKSFGDKKLFADLSFVLTPGIKLGLVGRNGSGKTTLLKTIIGEVQPDTGVIKRADELKVVWFDQNREQLDQNKSLKDSLSPTGDSVMYRGRSLHVSTWARQFLFRSDQLNMPISYLSGGEQARILIANLMLKSADILILDEPTNDLDIPSLEVLEESLEEFPGAVILVTHDRMMLDTLSSQILALDGRGNAEFFADYEQCEQVMERFAALPDSRSPAQDKKSARGSKPKSGMSTAEKRELERLPEKIEQTESSIALLQKEMEKPHVSSNYGKLQDLMKQQEAAQVELERLFQRWEELELKAAEQ
jgi:ATP-binding cassette subfamily F protein uup